MPVKLGNNNITFSGISEIYVGSNKVYSAAPPPYDPINDYFWVENTKSSDVLCEFQLVKTFTNSSWASLTCSYSRTVIVKYSTNKTNWSSTMLPYQDATFFRITIPANTRYYFKSDISSQTTNYSSYSSTYGGRAYIDAWGAYVNYGTAGTANFATVFRPNNSSDKEYIKLGGNIRTIIGSSDRGVGSTASMSYNRTTYNKGNNYVSVRSWLGPGTSVASDWDMSNLKNGLYFQYIKDASQLYIGSVDYRPDFLNCASDFVGPIYT